MRSGPARSARLTRWAVGGLLLTAAATASVAMAPSSGLPEALQACTQERDDSQRLACYDREMARLAATPGKPVALSAPQERKLQPAEARVTSNVTAIVARGHGRQLIRLANGETWVQGEAWGVFHVSVGDAVTIKPGTLGSFYMYAPSGVATRVTRAQ
jgi:hypothetical protein